MARQERTVMGMSAWLSAIRYPLSAAGAGALPEDEQKDQKGADRNPCQEQRRDDRLPARKSLILFVHFRLSADPVEPELIAES
jgi:hypothetical protein